MSIISWFVLLDVLLSVSVEGFFFVTPKPKTCVIVGGAVSLECGTYNDGYKLTFVYVAPPGIYVSSPPVFSEDLTDGGKKINTTFIVTKELNTTTVKCVAVGSTYKQTNPEPMYSYELPDGTRNNKVCQLANYIFVTWDPIFAPQGIGLNFWITDNMGWNYITSDLHHSFSYTVKNYSDYKANVTVIVNATAANQVVYSNSTIILKTLNGTIPLTVGYSCESDGGNWTFVFHTKLNNLNINECSINNETLKDAMIVSCNEEQCVNNSGNFSITKNEINSTNSLRAKSKYNHTLCFNYLGKPIISQPLETSTHDIQDIEYLSQNDTSLCLRFHLINHYKIESIHVHVKRGSELLPFNVTVPNKKDIFEWCAGTIRPTSSSNNGNWSLFACDGPGHICTNPAVVLENIMLNVNTATTQNTIATTYTTHTNAASLSRTPIVSFSSPSPSSTLSSTVNLTVPVTIPVLAVFLVLVIAIVIAVIIVVRTKSSKKSEAEKTTTESNVNEPN